MDLLVIGGTRFVGRHLVRAAQSRGHHVTLLHREGVDPFPEVEHLHADRDDGPAALAAALGERRFDATVDVCAYWPRHVRDLADALDGRGGQYVFVSSVSAYAEPDSPGADESTPLLELPAGTDDPDALPMTDQTYGPLKVAAERLAAERFDRLTVVRPTYVVGPYDPTDRFCWWLDRLSRGGEVLAPGPADAPLQLVDGADMGDWMAGLAEDGVTGAYHACSTDPGWTFADMVQAVATAVARRRHDGALGRRPVAARTGARRRRPAAVERGRARAGQCDGPGRRAPHRAAHPAGRRDDPGHLAVDARRRSLPAEGVRPERRAGVGAAQRIRMSPSWATEATSVPSAAKIRACANPRPPVAVGDTWS